MCHKANKLSYISELANNVKKYYNFRVAAINGIIFFCLYNRSRCSFFSKPLTWKMRACSVFVFYRWWFFLRVGSIRAGYKNPIFPFLVYPLIQANFANYAKFQRVHPHFRKWGVHALFSFTTSKQKLAFTYRNDTYTHTYIHIHNYGNSTIFFLLDLR